MAVVDTLWPSKFSTILEVDYDTPYRYFVAQGYSNSRCPSLVPTPHSTLTAKGSKGQQQLFKVLQKLEDELSEMSRSDFGDDNSEFGGRDNAAYDGSSEEKSTEVLSDIDEGFEMVDGKRAITLQDFGKFANRMASVAKQHVPFGATGSDGVGPVNRRQSYGGFGAPPQHSAVQPTMSLVQRENGTTMIQIGHTISVSEVSEKL